MMCRYYGHHTQCLFMNKFGNCKYVHSEDVRNAHQYIRDSLKEKIFIKKEEITNKLNPKGKLN